MEFHCTFSFCSVDIFSCIGRKSDIFFSLFCGRIQYVNVMFKTSSQLTGNITRMVRKRFVFFVVHKVMNALYKKRSKRFSISASVLFCLLFKFVMFLMNEKNPKTNLSCERKLKSLFLPTLETPFKNANKYHITKYFIISTSASTTHVFV